MKKPCILALAVCAPLLLCAPVLLQAQPSSDTGTIAGSVVDVAGKPIPNAAVTLNNESGGPPHAVVAGQDGTFSVAALPAGTYTIEVSAPSFAPSRRSGVKLAGVYSDFGRDTGK
jgi:hypothetical protein